MKLRAFNLVHRGPSDGVTIDKAAAAQFILRVQDCSGPAEASERTSINTAIALAKLVEILHRRKRITDEDVLELLSDYEKAD